MSGGSVIIKLVIVSIARALNAGQEGLRDAIHSQVIVIMSLFRVMILVLIAWI